MFANSEPRRCGCIDPEPLTIADIAGGGVALGVTKVPLDRQGVSLAAERRRRGQPRPQRMTGEGFRI